MLRRGFDWLLRDRITGRIVVAQWPNPALWIHIGARVVRGLTSPEGTAGTVVATAALLWWAGDEVFRGVNPFRRALGAVVAVATLLALV